MITAPEITPKNVLHFGFQRAEKETHSIVEVGGVKYYRIKTHYGQCVQVPLEDLIQAYAVMQLQDSLALRIAITSLDFEKCQKFGWSSELMWVLNTFCWYIFYKQINHLVDPAANIIEEMAKNMPKSQIKNAHIK